jgi:hypothetical protein
MDMLLHRRMVVLVVGAAPGGAGLTKPRPFYSCPYSPEVVSRSPREMGRRCPRAKSSTA